MLDEYVRDLKETLISRRDADLGALVANSSDRLGGKVQAYDLALQDIDDLLARYREPEEVPAAVRRYAGTVAQATRGAQRIGRVA